jgi:flagellar motor protein MotB
MSKKVMIIFSIMFVIFSILMSCKTAQGQKEENDGLRKDLSQMTKDNNNLQIREVDLVDRIQTLKNTIDDQNSQIVILKQQAVDLKKSNMVINSTKKSDLDAQIANLTKERDDQFLQLQQMQSKLTLNDEKDRLEAERLAAIQKDLENELADLIKNNNAEIYQYGGVLIVSISDQFLFDPDSPILKTSFSKRLDNLAVIFKKAPEKMIRVEGHTADNVLSGWTTSWELGAMRAVNVVKYLQDKAGIDPLRLVAVSMGRFRPIALNDTEVNRIKNRRVEIQLLDRELWETKELQRVTLK